MSPRQPVHQGARESRSVPGVAAHSIIPVDGDGPLEAGERRRRQVQSAHIEASSRSWSSARALVMQANPATVEEVRRILLSTRPHRPVRHRRRRARRAVLRTRSRPDPPRPSHRTRRVASPPASTPPRAAMRSASVGDVFEHRAFGAAPSSGPTARARCRTAAPLTTPSARAHPGSGRSRGSGGPARGRLVQSMCAISSSTRPWEVARDSSCGAGAHARGDEATASAWHRRRAR